MHAPTARSSARRGAFRPLRRAASRARRARAGAEACGRLLRLARACVAAAHDVVEASSRDASPRSRGDVLQRLAAAEAIGEALVATLEATAAVARAPTSTSRAGALSRLVRAVIEGAATAVRLSSSLDPDPETST